MKYAEAIAAIRAMENGDDLVAAIEAETSELKAQKTTAIGEKRKVIQNYNALSGRFKEVVDALGVEVESDDLIEQLKTLETKIKDLQTELTSEKEKGGTSDTELGQLQESLTALQAKYDESQSKLTTLERLQTAASLAAKAGAVPDVLCDLLGDRIDELTVKPNDDGDEVVMLGDKPLKEAIAADKKLSLYSSALFPETSDDKGKGDGDDDSLPGGSGGDDDSPSAAASYMKQRYAVPSFVTSK